MEAPVCDRWNVLIPTPINGACAHPCQRGGAEQAWPHITASCMQSEDTMHQLQAIVHVSLIVWRGKLPRHSIWQERNHLITMTTTLHRKQAASLGTQLWVPSTIICTFICKSGHTLLDCEIFVTLSVRNVVGNYSNLVLDAPCWR